MHMPMVVYAEEAEIGGPQVQGQPGIHEFQSASQGSIVRPYLQPPRSLPFKSLFESWFHYVALTGLNFKLTEIHARLY